MNEETKITVGDVLALPNGQSLLDQLDEMFPYFSSITFYPGYFVVTVAKGDDSEDLEFNDINLDHKVMHTYGVGGTGVFIEVSFNDVMKLMTTWKRDSKLGQLGI